MPTDGESGGRIGWRSAATRLLVSLACAAAVVLVGSRVNPPQRWAILEGLPRAADLNLAEVQFDPTSPRTMLDSIRKAAPPGALVADVDPLPDYWMPAEYPPQPTERLRNVRLGTIVEFAIRQSGAGLEAVAEPGRIVIDRPPPPSSSPSRQRDLVWRLYDIRSIVGPTPPPTPIPPTPGFNGAGIFGSPPTQGRPFDSWHGEEVAGLIRASVTDLPYDALTHGDARAWGGWMVVNATEAGHRHVEELLLLLRRGDSARVRPVAAAAAGGSR